MSIRIVHTADVHLDAAFKGLPARKAHLKREAIRDTFKTIIADCLAWQADLLAVAGDLFEAERLSPDTVGFLKSQFKGLGDIPVAIAPGNHDPYTASSPYAIEDWGDNVHIFSAGRAEAVELPSGVVLCGIAHTSHHMEGSLSDLVEKPAAGSSPSLLLAHASLEIAAAEKSPDDVWLPFSVDDLKSLGYTYAALGHYHNAREIAGPSKVAAAYPGAPEGLNFAETGRRCYLRVTVDEDGAAAERVGVSHLDYECRDVACDGFASRDEFFRAVATCALERPAETLLRIAARGRVEPGFNIAVEPPEELVKRHFHLEIVDRTAPDYDWKAFEEQDSLRGEVARLFRERIDAVGEQDKETLEKARALAMEALDGRAIELPAEVLRVD